MTALSVWTVGLAVVGVAIVAGFAGSAGAAEVPTGTFSIVAMDPLTGEIGVAVQSRAFSVGSAVPWAEAGVGAIATQALTNQAFGPKGLALLRQGLDSKTVLDRLLADDPQRENRQVAVIDTTGAAVNFTGSKCLAWAGGLTGKDFACQGNILVSENVVTSMAGAFEATQGELADRLLAALVAGQAAGGDKRGMQSAALLVVRPSEDYPQYRYRYIDLRVEDDPDPINELKRLYSILQQTDLLEAHLNYADYYTRIDRSDLALHERNIVGSMLKKALEDSSRDAEYLNNMAWSCAIAGLFLPEALEAAKRAVALEPGSANFLDTLAEVYFRSDMPEDAIVIIQRAIELDPESTYYKDQLKRFQTQPE
jgi:uncharacterized Ntn-hydrolase superfamily protein